MKKLKLNYMVVTIFCLAILLVLNAMGVFAYRDSVLSSETHKDIMLNFIIKYDTLVNELHSNARIYLNTNDERYRTEFFILRNEYLNNDNVSLQYRAFTENQASDQLKEIVDQTGFTLSAQADYLEFTSEEKAFYTAFLDSYHQLIARLTEAVETRDMLFITGSELDYLYNAQSENMNLLSKSYIDRLNFKEDLVLARQKLLEITLIILSLLLLGFASVTFYVIVRQNAFNSYFRQLFNTVVENINVGITILDQYYCFDYMNPMYKEIMGVTMEDALGKSLQEVFDQKIVEAIEQVMEEENRNGQMDLIIGNRRKHIAYSFFTICDEEGNSKYVQLIQDSTSTNNMQTQLRKQLKEIEFYSHAKDSFIANISHEIKTPINAILGMVHFLKSTRLSQNQKDLVKKIETSSDILLTIISDVLDLSKIRSKSLNLYPSDFSLAQVIENVEDMFSNQLASKGLEWRRDFEFDKDLCIHLDKTRFVQVLVNLINNAYKFTEEGYIKLSAETMSESNNIVYLQFCVEDSGIGIAEKDISKLFHEFEQLENHLTKQHQGTGLGLFICKNIIESMDGRMWVKSVKGEGSKFYFSLPAEKAFETALLNSGTGIINSIPLDGNGGRALVVEDTEINVEVAVKLLNDVNIACDTAADGLIAVQMCKKKGPDYYKVILMDIHMPNMDGYTAANILKKEMRFKTPIVALTASDINDQIVAEHADTINDFILKPFKASAFYKTLAPYFANTNSTIMDDSMISADEDPESMPETDPEDDPVKDENDPFAGREEAIKNLGGLESIYYKHIEKFKVNYVNSTSEIKELLEKKNYEEARRLAHSIKGLGGTLGMLKVQSAGAALEKAILKGEGYDLSEELADFDKELKAAIAAI
ncbi:ATP-binding protein [Sinanaerobacter chloroacetimidivorans]|jgi:PAS domain S-box-containing protein|uniref:Circadian input-output histidine kinase CikA n=1 Tax=Sinanaerobacter chloroacetimidivorans TaxID=2818044 RepID=A0A8J7W7Q2_9FIRM|nr:ATP-binding protein [Sinanaerobacter chloroacetimidivorans]MBR0600410.1 response regulator [Sinanaerobacter chloroacetimidivorans]